MSDLNYNINANVTGREEVQGLRGDLDAINEVDATVTIEGAEEAAASLETISETDAATKIEEVGTAAGTASTPVGGLGTSFKTLVAAIGVAQIAGYGLDFVMGLVRTRLDYIAETKAWDAAQVEEYRAAVDDVGAGLEAIETKLREAGEFTNVEATGLFGLGGGTTIDAASTLGAFGFTVDDVARAIRGGDEALDAFEDQFREVSGSGDLTRLVMGSVRDEADAYAEATNGAAQRTAFFAESQQSANEALQAMLDEQDPMRRFTEEWDLLTSGLRDGSIDTEAGADAINTLAQGLHLTTDEVLALAQAEVDRVLGEAAAGAEAFADAFNSVDFQAADVVGATSAMSAFTDQLFAAGNEVQAREAAFDALAASVDGYAFTMNAGTAAGRAQQDALEGVARVIDTDLAQAYDDANGSQAEFIASATQIGTETLARLQTELGLTDVQVGHLATTLGLTEGDYQARFEMAGIAEAQLQLGLLSGAIQGLPATVESAVNLQILAGDYVGARDTIVDYYEGNPVPATIEAEAETTAATDDIASAAAEPYTATIDADADTAAAAEDLLATTSQDRKADIFAVAHTEFAGDQLALLENDRDMTVNAEALTGNAEAELNNAARDRTSTIYVRTVSTGGGGGGGGLFGQGFGQPAGPMGAARATRPMGAAPMGLITGGDDVAGGGTIVLQEPATEVNVHIHTPVIGNRYETMRMIRRSVQDGVRLSGSRRG